MSPHDDQNYETLDLTPEFWNRGIGCISGQYLNCMSVHVHDVPVVG